MSKNQIKIVIIAILFLISLACNGPQRLLLNIAGVQGQVDSLTQVAVPIERETPTSTLTLVPAQADTEIEVATPHAQASPTSPNEETLLGKWSGTAQWLCDDQPSWWITMDFMRTGNVRITFSGPSEPIVNNFPWFLDGNNIKIQTEYSNWVGAIAGNSITGTFSEENCNGVWSVTKQ